MSFLKLGKYFMALSGLLAAASLVLIFIPGPVLSIDFTGGTLMEITMPEGKDKETVRAALGSFFPGEVHAATAISVTKEGTALMRLRTLTNEEHLALLGHLETTLGAVEERQFTTIGPTVGSNLKRRSIWALGIACVAIMLYVAFAFRNVPRKLGSWKFGIITVITLFHDVLVTTGLFVILSHFTSFEMDTLFITALLIILGYSVMDTVVIFDRIRENLTLQQRGEDFATVAERSLRESITRSLNTVICTLIMLIALFLFGSESIRWFVAALILGISIGTYSSIFLATPLLVYWRNK